MNMAMVYQRSGELVKAKNLLNKALEEIDNNEIIGWVYYYLGIISRNLGEYDESIFQFKKCISLHRKIGSSEIYYSYNGLARTYDHFNKFGLAKKYYIKSLKYREKYLGINSLEFALGNLNYGDFLVRNGKLEDGRQYLYKANKIYIDLLGTKHVNSAYCLQKLGEYYIIVDSLHKSLQYFQQALIAQVYDFNNTDIYQHPHIWDITVNMAIIDILKLKARAFQQLAEKQEAEKNYRAALQALELVIQVIDRLKMGYQFEQSRIELTDNEEDAYTQIIYACHRLFEITGQSIYKEKAFLYADQIKYSALTAAIREDQALAHANIPDSLIDFEQALRQNISSYNSLVAQEMERTNPDSARLDALNNKLFTLYRRQDSLVRALERNYPVYYNIKYRQESFNIWSLQQQLKRNQAIVEYTITDSLLYIFTLTHKDTEMHTFPIDRSFHQLLTTYIDDFQSEFLDYDNYTHQAHQLYQYLIEPLTSVTNKKELIIIPDRQLGLISFESLLTKPATQRNFKKLDYLIYDHVISYSFTAAMLTGKEEALSAEQHMLAMAPAYPGNDYLNIFHNTEKEIEIIDKKFRTTTFTGSKATKEAFLNNYPDKRMIHLAMHGEMDTANNSTRLVFYPDGEHLLFSGDLYGLDLDAELVVLSACNTGRGMLRGGEGILSLGRDFLMAGAESVIYSLWDADSKADKEIYKRFYTRLNRGMSSAKALHKAKKEYLKRADAYTASPLRWSNHIIAGKPGAIYQVNRWYLLVPILVLVLLITIWIVRSKKSY
jgi:CHAT domain-containing protein/Tfp pilus assembly protein PilF